MKDTEFEILKYPSAALFKKTKPVTDITAETLAIIRKMIETLHKSNGVGLAANQVGVPLSILVMSVPSKDEKHEDIVLINPSIIEKRGRVFEEEGCLSFPDLYLKIKRSRAVKVKAINRQGNSFIIEGEEVTARILQHEIDHLKGKTLLDRLPLFKRLSVKRLIKKKIKNDEW